MLLVISGVKAYAIKPLAGIAGIYSNSPRSVAISRMLSGHISKILESTGRFSMVNSQLLSRELRKFNCLEEKCIIRFACDADIILVILGEIEDNGNYMILRLTAYGTEIPYQGKAISRYAMDIPMTGKYGTAQYNYMAEEHAMKFLAGLLKHLKLPLSIGRSDSGALTVEEPLSGTYTVYRVETDAKDDTLNELKKIGRTTIIKGIVEKPDLAIEEKDVIFVDFKKRGAILKKAYYQRKKDIVFKKPSATDTLFKVLFTGPASALMPIVAPFFGYYRNGDWYGLSLWALNVTPYLYFEINGLTRYFRDYYKKKRSVPWQIRTDYHFALYMVSVGGFSLFIDSFAYAFIKRATNYQGIQRFMGNSFSAGYLALVSGGAGHFYRGYRLWGYLYFHVDNLLMYFTLREFSPTLKYNRLTDSFSKGKINKTRAYTLLSVACLVKVGEVIHAVLLKDNIDSGKPLKEGFAIEPIIVMETDDSTTFGLQYSYHF
jgi:hypothetical protein